MNIRLQRSLAALFLEDDLSSKFGKVPVEKYWRSALPFIFIVSDPRKDLYVKYFLTILYCPLYEWSPTDYNSLITALMPFLRSLISSMSKGSFSYHVEM